MPRGSKFRKWRRKGFDAERSLKKYLRNLGYVCFRFPTSGSTSEPIPDLFAIKKDSNPCKLIAFEVKAITTRYYHYTIKAKQVKKLLEFIDAFSGIKGLECRAAIAFHFLQGKRTKSPWIVKFVDEAKDVKIHLWDESDMPELTEKTLSRKIKKKIKWLRELHANDSDS